MKEAIWQQMNEGGISKNWTNLSSTTCSSYQVKSLSQPVDPLIVESVPYSQIPWIHSWQVLKAHIDPFWPLNSSLGRKPFDKNWTDVRPSSWSRLLLAFLINHHPLISSHYKSTTSHHWNCLFGIDILSAFQIGQSWLLNWDLWIWIYYVHW